MRRVARLVRMPLVWLARLIAAAAFRGFEVQGRRSRRPGPRLIVANHFGGLLDVIVVMAALRELPHVVAKSTLFERLPLRLALRALGVVPVYRRIDGGGAEQNRASFAEVHRALARGDSVLIFPEGTVTDSQRLQPIRTGAARMVIGAIADGTAGIEIVPVGITYEDKVASRSRVLAEIGPTVPADSVVGELTAGGPIDEDDHRVVIGLTEAIGDALRAVTPDFGSLLREAEMMRLAELHVRTLWRAPFRDPSVADLREVAQRLARLSPDLIEPVLDLAGRYAFALSAAGLSDDVITPRPGLADVTRLILRSAVAFVVLSPLALFGATANAIPTLLVLAVGSGVQQPVSKGTARIVTALVVFPIAWAVVIWVTEVEGWGILVLLLALAGASVALVVSLQLLVEIAEGFLRWRQVRGRRALLDDLAARRAPVQGAIDAVLGVVPPQPAG